MAPITATKLVHKTFQSRLVCIVDAVGASVLFLIPRLTQPKSPPNFPLAFMSASSRALIQFASIPSIYRVLDRFPRFEVVGPPLMHMQLLFYNRQVTLSYMHHNRGNKLDLFPCYTASAHLFKEHSIIEHREHVFRSVCFGAV